MKKVLMSVSVSIVCTMLLSSAVCAAFEMDGISLTSIPSNLPYYYQADAILDRFIYDNVNWVAINAYIYQATSVSTDIYKHAQYTPTDDALINCIQDAHQRGLKVFLKVNVNSEREEEWRGEFAPTNVAAWFANYTTFMTQYAQLAQNYGVELFSVGCEFNSLSVSANLSHWTSVINAIKSVYSGKLVYSANWDEYTSVPFWNQLDYIGIDAYFPLDNDNNATVADISADWTTSSSTGQSGQHWFNEIDAFRQTQGKDVIFTEIGYPSADGGAEYPWRSDLTPVNLQLQANCYEGTITFWSAYYSWLKGMFFWESYLGVSQGGSRDTTLLLLDKPAEDVLRQKYADGTYPPTFPSLFYPVNTTVTTAQPAFSWSYSILLLPVYEKFDWESGGTMGWYPQTGGGSSGFALPPAPVATTEQHYGGLKSMKCHLVLTQGTAEYESGYMQVGLAEPVDFTNRPVSVALWLPSALVGNEIRFWFEDTSYQYVETNWQEITTGNSWIVYTTTLPADIGNNGGGDITKIQRVGFQIAGWSISGFQFDGYIYVDDFTFGAESNVTYQIQVDDSQTFTAPVIDQNTLTSIFYNPSNSLVNGTYFWRVRANEGSGWGDWSTTAMFNVTNSTGTFLKIGKDPAGDITSGIDLVRLWGRREGGTLYLRYQTAAAITSFDYRYKVYLDTDKQATTGYRNTGFKDFGADFVIESFRLYRYTGSGADYTWTFVGDMVYELADNQVDLAIPETSLGLSGGIYDIYLLVVGDDASSTDYMRWAAGPKILTPAYFWPDITVPANGWSQMIAAAQNTPAVDLTAIMNPNSGPGTGLLPNYQAAVNAFRAQGGSVIGYVPTDYGQRALTAVKNDMWKYHSWYKIDGFFLDEMTATNGTLADPTQYLRYYRELYTYAKALNPFYRVVGNPGVAPTEDYAILVNGARCADTLIIFEQSGDLYDADFILPAWVLQYPADLFAAIPYNVSSAAAMEDNVLFSASRNIGNLYMTDDNLPNPWDTLPSYWSDFVSFVNWLQRADIRDTIVITGLVRNAANQGIPNVTLQGFPPPVSTNNTGMYRATVRRGWSGTATPQKAGYLFTPVNRTYTAATADQKNQNYTASPLAYLLWTK